MLAWDLAGVLLGEVGWNYGIMGTNFQRSGEMGDRPGL